MQPNHVLTSAKVDQLCYVCIKTRTIKKMKASKYCTTSQIRKQRGSFQGIDNFSITNFGDFRFTSVLLDESVNIYIAMRPGITSLLLKLQR